jgi:hypothetical protein
MESNVQKTGRNDVKPDGGYEGCESLSVAAQ